MGTNLDNNSKTTLSLEDFAGKIEWEGGIIGALEYGLYASDCEDEGLARLWQELESKYAAMRPVLREINKYLSERGL